MKRILDTMPGAGRHGLPGRLFQRQQAGGTNNEAELYKTWRLVEVNGETIDTTGIPKPLEFTFERTDSQFSGSAGCNRIFGKFNLYRPG